MAMIDPTVLRLRRRMLTVADYKERGAEESDYARLITVPTSIVDAETGQVALVYLAPIEEDTRVLVDVLRHTSIGWQERTGGMPSRSRVIGYTPRNALRNDFCTSASLATEDPAGHAVICSFAPVVAHYYERYGPAVYARHQRQARRVLPDWTLEETAFTSGIVNYDNPLPYHYDAGNFRQVWSAMLGFKQKVRGGYLAVPEYNIALQVANNSLTLFDGQSLLHGVTPFRVASGGYRYTIVFYSREQMWQCLPLDDEVARIQRRRLERDRRRGQKL